MNKKLLSILSLLIISSLNAMDNPHPDQFFTPTKVPIQIYRTIDEIIEGADHECDLAEVSPRVWKASPLSCIQGLRKVFDRRSEQELRKKGITPELIHSLMPEASEMLKEECEQYRGAKPVNPNLKRQMSEVSRAMKVSSPECKSVRLDNPGFCMGELVLLDEDYLHHEAPTPRRKKAILAHEMRHRLNRDRVKHDATIMAHEVVGAAISPGFFGKKTRCAETFADLESSAVTPEFAQAALRLTRKAHQMHGDGQADSHPSHKQRRRLAELSCDLHEQEPKRIKAKRNLREDYKDIWDC
ncbi:hypothetical protein BH09DEP1_BH09DEP1_5510 [soil metagenome]